VRLARGSLEPPCALVDEKKKPLSGLPCMCEGAPRKTVAALHFAEGRSQENDSCVALRRAGDSMCKQHTFAPARLARLALLSLEPPCTLVVEKKKPLSGPALWLGVGPGPI